MGIDVHGLRFLEYALRVNGPMKSTLTIGRQRLQAPRRELQKYLMLQESSLCLKSSFVDDLLIEQFGAVEVASIDVSDYENATHVRDLNMKLEPRFPKFDSVLDAGSLEHVFDIRTAFENIAHCCRLGGQILHILPANNFVGHGFYQFSPEFFYSLYSGPRGFADTEVYLADLGKPRVWWKVAPPAGTSRSTAMSSQETYALVRTRKISHAVASGPIQQSDYLATWDSSESTDVARRSRYRGRLIRLSEGLPTDVRARLMQLERRASRSIYSRNPALSKVRPPSQRCSRPRSLASGTEPLK